MASESPDSVCAQYASRGVKISIRKMETGIVLIEGSAEALRFLARLVAAQAEFSADCGFEIGPRSAGNALFTSDSDLGIYIHRTPCKDQGHNTSG
jgi:hypothetical protein